MHGLIHLLLLKEMGWFLDLSCDSYKIGSMVAEDNQGFIMMSDEVPQTGNKGLCCKIRYYKVAPGVLL